MKKGKTSARRSRKDDSEAYSFQSYGSDEPLGMVREGGDGQASPDNEWPDISDEGELPLTLHSVSVGIDKSKFGSELGVITKRISKLLNEYESVYDDDTSHGSIGASVTGQIYLENILTDYYALCQEREDVLESLHDSLDWDEEDILDRLERMSSKSKDDIEGSDQVVKETFEEAKQRFERLKELNREMLDMSRQGQDVTKLEEEKNQLQEELLMYKRMAVQHKLGSMSKTRRKSVAKKDESQQWKLVAKEMLDIVKGIKLEGKTDKVQLEKDLNMILMAMGGLNEQIEKLKIELAASEVNIKTLQEEKDNLQTQKKMKEQEIKDVLQEVQQCKMTIKRLEEEKKLEAEKVLIEEQREKSQAKEEVKQPDTSDDILQAQLRDQKNKALKLEEQNKELQSRIEAYLEEECERKEKEKNLAQMLSLPDAADCSNCQLLGRQVLTSKEEISLLSSKVEELEQQLASLQDQLAGAHEKLDNAMKSQVDVSKRTDVIEGREATSLTPSPVQVSEVSSEIEEQEKPSKTEPATKSRRKKTETKRKQKEVKRKVTKTQTTEIASKGTSEDESKSEEETQETREANIIKEKSVKEVAVGEDVAKEETGKGEMRQKEGRKEEKIKDETAKGKKEDKVETKEHREDRSSYIRVIEAGMLTLSDKGSQTVFQGRLPSISTMGSKRDSIASWKASKKDQRNSLADAIMSIAPPNVLEQETNIAASVINEEVDRLCEDISGLMEYGYDLIEQEEKMLRTQAAKHLSAEDKSEALALKELLPGSERRQSIYSDVLATSDLPSASALYTHAFPSRDRRQSIFSDALPSRDRRQSVQSDAFLPKDRRQSHYGDVTPVTERRQSIFGDVSPVTDHRQSIRRRSMQLDTHHDEPGYHQHGAERFGLVGAAPLPEVEDETEIEEKMQEYLRGTRLEGGRKLCEGNRIKQQMASMAQTAINIIKDTGNAITYRLNEKLGFYERFYELWRETRKARLQLSLHRGPVAGKGVLTSDQERHVKSREDHEEEIETDVLLPLTQESKGILQSQGLMMIGLSGAKSEPPPQAPQLPAPRKRGKPKVMTRQQQLMKQKALLEKARHVETKDTRILTVQAAGHRSPGSPRRGLHGGQQQKSAPPSFNLPFIAHGIGGIGKAEESSVDKKFAIPRKLSTVEDVQKSLWPINKQGIQKYFSANDVPAHKIDVRTTLRRKNKSKLPTLNIGNLFRSI